MRTAVARSARACRPQSRELVTARGGTAVATSGTLNVPVLAQSAMAALVTMRPVFTTQVASNRSNVAAHAHAASLGRAHADLCRQIMASSHNIPLDLNAYALARAWHSSLSGVVEPHE